MAYKDISIKGYPKTLVIRNHEGGMIWQIYHVKQQWEADRLSQTASINGFLAITLEDHQPIHEETWPNWRETCGWFK